MEMGRHILGWLCAMALPVLGQVTNVGTAETNQIRLEWTAMPGNPYRVYATPDLVAPAWTNLTPDGLAFADPRGSYALPMGERKGFCFAVASDYLIVDLSGGPEAANYPVRYTNAPPEEGWGDEYKTAQLVLRRIPGGTFTMGSPVHELGRYEDETQHPVALTKDYYLGVFEVTQKQWERVMGNWPSYFNGIAWREARPVEMVSYDEIRGGGAGTNWPADGNVDEDSFLGRLRTKTGHPFDLPTEAQWERACRAGTSTALNTGHSLTNVDADAHMDAAGRYWFNGGSEYAQAGDDRAGTAKAGSYRANAWGVYDLHGNAWEWCLDGYGAYAAPAVDPQGADSRLARVRRGGGWSTWADRCRSADRDIRAPGYQGSHMGFRLARTLP
ncbi:MAG: formylglycine-generating enzyme family protein [Opitutae bacterium]|nr:formylglycine-generating enzyme family protein [Opitutae bacterium]